MKERKKGKLKKPMLLFKHIIHKLFVSLVLNFTFCSLNAHCYKFLCTHDMNVHRFAILFRFLFLFHSLCVFGFNCIFVRIIETACTITRISMYYCEMRLIHKGNVSAIATIATKGSVLRQLGERN